MVPKRLRDAAVEDDMPDRTEDTPVRADAPTTVLLSAEEALSRLDAVDAPAGVRRAARVDRVVRAPVLLVAAVLVAVVAESTVVSSFSLALFRARVEAVSARLPLVMLLKGALYV